MSCKINSMAHINLIQWQANTDIHPLLVTHTKYSPPQQHNKINTHRHQHWHPCTVSHPLSTSFPPPPRHNEWRTDTDADCKTHPKLAKHTIYPNPHLPPVCPSPPPSPPNHISTNKAPYLWALYQGLDMWGKARCPLAALHNFHPQSHDDHSWLAWLGRMPESSSCLKMPPCWWQSLWSHSHHCTQLVCRQTFCQGWVRPLLQWHQCDCHTTVLEPRSQRPLPPVEIKTIPLLKTERPKSLLLYLCVWDLSRAN